MAPENGSRTGLIRVVQLTKGCAWKVLDCLLHVFFLDGPDALADANVYIPQTTLRF